jgi:hypothetical protein
LIRPGGKKRAYIVGVADIVDAPAAKGVVGALCCSSMDCGLEDGIGQVRLGLRTNIVSAHVGCLRAKSKVAQRSAVGQLAQSDLVLATVGHLIGELHVVVDCLIDLHAW